ncbi:PadR family transcriptional regulator [Arthrobacter alpinus]|uniref:PadR family transcriptional regulator n=1 Tax=Arthrobacter alpinus TaxID=656366 RepID=UPI0005C890F6|nr:PadR family transcriptional regulator [Arthrobacter alpinus]ALV47084.1 PadR family transcriptional regulator [Arthrobacter alpinus]
MRELTRAAVRLLILHHAAEEDIHGAWMSEELSNHGYSISPGTLHPTLHRMEEQGLLSSRPEVVNGRPRRIYRTTSQGIQALAEGRMAVAKLAAEVLPHSAKGK